MNESDEQALRVLHGLRVQRVHRAADMLCIQFGELHTVPGRDGHPYQLGEHALHLQCPWRFVRSDSIILASTDFYYYPEGDESYDWDRGGESLFDRQADRLNRDLSASPFHITGITCGPCHSFQLTFTPDFHFAVFPAASQGSAFDEFWRLFQPSTKHRHYVVSSEPTGNA